MTAVEVPSNGLHVFTKQADALIASARKLDYEADKEKYRKRQKGWSDEAWRYYDECPEIWFGANFVANCLRKVRLFAATQPDVSEPPTPVDEVDEEGNTVLLTPLAAQAVDLVERLGRAEGGIGGIMAGFGLNLSVAGDCILVGADDDMGNEHWAVYSCDQVFVNSQGQWAIRTQAGDKKGKPLGLNSVAYRVWRPHPRWSDNADAPMRPLLDVVEELMILSRAVRATGRSRLAGAGLLLWPAEANLGSSTPSVDPSVAGQPVDPVLADLMQAMMTPIGDEGVAAAVVPLLLRVPAQYIDLIRHLIFERPIDPEMARQREELRKRIATGLDIPAEVLLGLSDLNHWNAWMVDEQTFKAHLEPLVIQICGSLTSEYLRPLLGVTDEIASDLLVWYDASALIGHPNRGQDANDAFDRYTISEAAYRGFKGFADDDAPDDTEIQERVARKSIERLGTTRTGEPLATTTELDGTTRGAPAAAAAVAASGALTASISPSRLRKIGWRLANRDRLLRTTLAAAADASMFRALERAGATLRRHSSKDAAVKAILTDIPNHLVAAHLGHEAVLTLGVDTEQMLADSFDNLSMQFDRQVQRAQQDFRALLSDEYDSGDLEDIDTDAVAEVQASSRREAESLLVAAMVLLASTRLFNPHPEAPALGEHDNELLVPPGYLREALSIAGGAPAPSRLDGVVDGPVGGVLTGPTAMDVWNSLGVGPQGYEWFVGAPAFPFDPHQELDGVEFATFQDEQLLADAGEFPFVDFYHPGDHLGCQCDFAPLLG